MPQVKIISPQRNPYTINTNATTWGQLKQELGRELSDIDKMTVVLSTNKNSLDHNDAELPTTDYKLYFTPKAIKAGGTNLVAVLEGLKEKFSTAIDDLIEDINDGDYDDDSIEEDDEEDADQLELRKIQGGLR